MTQQSNADNCSIIRWFKRKTIFFNVLSSPQIVNNPYPYYQKLRTRSPIHYYKHQKCWVVTRHKDVKEILSNPLLFKSTSINNNIIANTILHLDGAEHTKLRRQVSPLFTAKKIAKIETSIRTIANDLIDVAIAQQKNWDFVTHFANPLPILVALHFVGISSNYFAMCQQGTKAVILQIFGSNEPQILKNVQELLSFCKDHATYCQKTPDSNSIITELLNQNRLTLEEAANLILLIMVAATETTTHLLGNTILILLKNYELKQQVYQNPQLIPALINESLRYQSPVQLITRHAATDAVLSGVPIKANSHIALFIGSANRDPDHFIRPDEFILNRNTKSHLGFGWGNHFCLGVQLALLEARTAIEVILERLPELKAAEPLDKLEYFENPTVRGLKRLILSI